MDQIKIGKFIAACRKERGFFQKDIAQKLGVSEKTVSKWECGSGMPEVIYMEPLCEILGITVNELLAGEKMQISEFMRLIDISRLELLKQLEFEQLKMRLYKLYGIEIETMDISENGAGGITYFVNCKGEKFVVKYPSENEMNNPDIEIRVCGELLSKGIPSCRFIPNKQGKMISSDESGRQFTVQHFYDGVTYDYNDAPTRLQPACAAFLAKIHLAMKNIKNIPTGIGEDFFKYRTIDGMASSYEKTLSIAKENKDRNIAQNIRSNMQIIQNMPVYRFDINKFSTGGTHGDYTTSQIIWKNEKINGVIDWTCVCTHPYIWEIVRSYIFMAPEVKKGEIDINSLIDYIKEYMKYSPLNSYDIENAGKLLFYFLAVCNFYGQYYGSISKNRHIYLKQANIASKLLVWLEKHIDELNGRLYELSCENFN